MMRRDAHVFVDSDAVRATLTHRGVMVWQGMREVGDDHVEAALYTLLQCVPRRRWQRPFRIIATIGGHASRVKALRGLPAVSDARTLAAMIRENVSQFFLGTVPLVATSVYRREPGEVVAGVIDAAMIEAVARACTAAGSVLHAVHPAKFGPSQVTLGGWGSVEIMTMGMVIRGDIFQPLWLQDTIMGSLQPVSWPVFGSFPVCVGRVLKIFTSVRREQHWVGVYRPGG